MTTEKMIAMVKRTNEQFKMGLKDNDIERIIGMCDNIYLDKINEYIEEQNKHNDIFLKALGRAKYSEVKRQIDEGQA